MHSCGVSQPRTQPLSRSGTPWLPQCKRPREESPKTHSPAIALTNSYTCCHSRSKRTREQSHSLTHMKMRLPPLVVRTRCHSRGGRGLMRTCDALTAPGAYALARTCCLASVRTRVSPLATLNALLLTRLPLAAHAAGIAQSSVCADARLPHARHANTLSATNEQERATRALARDVSLAVDTYAVALKVERTVACAAGHGSARSLCVVAIVAAHAAEHVNALADIHAQTSTTHAPARELSRTCGHVRHHF